MSMNWIGEYIHDKWGVAKHTNSTRQINLGNIEVVKTRSRVARAILYCTPMNKLKWVVHMQRKSLIDGLGRPHPDEQEEPEHSTALCTSYPSIRMWKITRAQTGLSPPAGYLYKPWDRVAFKRGYQPRHHAWANKHHSSLAQGHPCLSGALVLERPIKEDETKTWYMN